MDNSKAIPSVHYYKSDCLNSQLINKWELEDIRRLHNPFTKKFSHFTNCQRNSARLDYCFTSATISSFVKECEISSAYGSDHSPLFITLHFPGPPVHRRFNFPVNLCYSDQFKIQLRIRGSALGFKKLHTMYHKEMIESIENDLAQVQHQSAFEKNLLLKASYWEKTEQLKEKLNDVYADLTEQRYAANLARWYSKEGCTSKYFLSKFKEDRNHQVISHLLTNEGMVDTNQNILKEAVHFYSLLYAKDSLVLPTDKLDETPQISQFQFDILNKPISLEELHESLKAMKTTLAPGSDGLTVMFYLYFWDEIKEYLIASYNYAFDHGFLSISKRLGLIILIPKKLRNLLLIINWRPITLLNVDFKILTKLFALRLKLILPDIIHPGQRGFVHGCRIDEGVLDIYALLDLVEHDDIDGLLCTIDIAKAKAFDSVDWEFVKYALRLYGFPEFFLKWFDILCSERIVRIMNNGQWLDPINVYKGLAQGCPLSPLLFVLSIEILAIRIRANPEIIGISSQGLTKKIHLVADDILLAFQNSYSAHLKFLQNSRDFHKNQG